MANEPKYKVGDVNEPKYKVGDVNEPKYKVGDVLVPKYKVGDVPVNPSSASGKTRTVKSVKQVWKYRFVEKPSCYEEELEDWGWKLKEPAEEMTLAEVCKELGRTIKIVK